MYTLIVIVHVIACFLMIGAILLQSGKGAEIGACIRRVESNRVRQPWPGQFSEQADGGRGRRVHVDVADPSHPGQRTDVFLHRHRPEEERDLSAGTTPADKPATTPIAGETHSIR